MAAGWVRTVIEHYSDGVAPFEACRRSLENFHRLHGKNSRARTDNWSALPRVRQRPVSRALSLYNDLMR